jgi:hypothetical protein
MARPFAGLGPLAVQGLLLCARSFSPLHSSAPPLPFRLARSLLKPLKLLQPTLLQSQLTPLLSLPTLLQLQLTLLALLLVQLLQLQLTPLLVPLTPPRALLTLPRMLLAPLRMPLVQLLVPLAPLRTLQRRCNLSLQAKIYQIGRADFGSRAFSFVLLMLSTLQADAVLAVL